MIDEVTEVTVEVQSVARPGFGAGCSAWGIDEPWLSVSSPP